MVCGRQDRVRTVHMACAAALHTPACVMSLLVQRGTECWKVGLERGPREGTAAGCEETA